jgi:hypothetical protein
MEDDAGASETHLMGERNAGSGTVAEITWGLLATRKHSLAEPTSCCQVPPGGSGPAMPAVVP